jgi:tRNA dimethylallyltransferase
LEEAKPGSLHALLETVDPEEAKRIHPHSTRYLVRALEIVTVLGKPKSQLAIQRPVPRPLLMIGLRRSKETTNALIDLRVEQMVHEGLADEVKILLEKGYTANDPGMKSIGYSESIDFIEGKLSKYERKQQIKIHTHRYAKRQRTRFRRYIADAQHSPKPDVMYRIFNVEEM